MLKHAKSPRRFYGPSTSSQSLPQPRVIATSILLKILLLASLLCKSLAAANTPQLDLLVEHFSSHDKNAADVFRQLAQQVHMPIGISGFAIDRPAKTEKLISIDISVDIEQKTLRALLDEICSKDPDYSWRSLDGQSIGVQLGPRPLSLIDVAVDNLTLRNSYQNEVLVTLLHLPTVKTWEKVTGCKVGHLLVIVGNLSQDTGPQVSLTSHAEPLWQILNEVSTKNQSFFWSAVGSSRTSGTCYIFLNP